MYEQNTNYLNQHIDILSFRDLAAGTIATYASYMTQFIDWTESSLSGKPLSDITWDELLPKVPTKKEVNSILDAVHNPKHKAELALLYSSGIRVSELMRLKCGDIHHSKQCIYISKSKNRHDRYAVFSQKAFTQLVAYIRTFHSAATKQDWLFPGRKAGSHIHQQSIYNTFKKWLSILGLSDAGYTLHSLRHYVECFKMVSDFKGLTI
jgi:site-specific recombinase XerD